METMADIKKTVKLILKVIPLAMGVAVTTLAILGEIDLMSALLLIGIGVACLGVKAVSERTE